MTWFSPDVDWRRLPLPALVLTAVLGAAGCGGEQVAEQEPQLRPVRYLEVQPGGATQRRVFTGQAQAVVRSTLSFKVAGTIASLPVKVGDAVGPGEVIATLAPRDYEIRVQEAEATVTRARAELRNATANYDRVRSLYETNTASKGELDQARTGFDLARAQLRASEKQLEAARLQLTYTRLVSPGACVVAATPATENENVAVGTPVADVTCGEAYEVRIAVPELLIAGIDAGDEAVVQFDALQGKRFIARVTEVGIAATDVSTTFPVIVVLEESDPEIRSGMAAEVVFEFSAVAAGRLLLPPVAVGEDRDGRFVLLLESGTGDGPGDQGIVRRQSVTVGDLTASGLEILTGVAVGDRVVTAGISRLQDGMAVRVPAGG